MNQYSSRSHAIFQLVITQTTLIRAKSSAMDKTSRVSMVDLAGLLFFPQSCSPSC